MKEPKTYMSHLQMSDSPDQAVSSPQENLYELRTHNMDDANAFVVENVRTGPFGLFKKEVKRPANPELYDAMKKHTVAKALVFMDAELFASEQRGELVKAQCKVQLNSIISNYQIDKTIENSRRINEMLPKLEREAQRVLESILDECEQAFKRIEARDCEFIKQRQLAYLQARVDHIFYSFDKQARSMSDAFNRLSIANSIES